MSRTFLLQDWTTIRSSLASSLVQDPDAWLDLDGYSDVSCWIEIAEVTPPRASCVQLTLETAPSADDAYFVPIAPAVSIGTSAPFVQPSSTPTLVRSAKSLSTNNLMRHLRWNLKPAGSGTWDLTFRIHVIASRTTTFVPPLIGGCAIWFRADLGLTLSGSTVTGGNDQSGTGDVNKNLTSTGTPTLATSDPSYFGAPTISFSGATQYMTSGSWATPLVQPNTWLLVGHRTSASSQMDAMDGATSGYGQLIAGATGNATLIYAGTNVSTPTSPAYAWTSPSVVMAEFNGAASTIYVNNLTSPAATNNSGTANFDALSVASHNPAFGASNFWTGTIAEIVAYAGMLSARSKSQLRSYLFGRYGIAIG